MRNLVPEIEDFLDAIWDFDESMYNSRRKSNAEVEPVGKELPGENME